MQRQNRETGFLLAGLFLLGMSCPLSAGEQVPFKGRMEGIHVSRTPIVPPVVFDVFETTGNATHLGRFDLVIEAVVDFGTLPPTAEGTMTFTAANGDTIVAHFTGSSALVEPGLVLITEHATIDPDNSTGRFAGATGSFTLKRLADAATGVNGVTVGSFEGSISQPAKMKKH
jgi:hypothetical protein